MIKEEGGLSRDAFMDVVRRQCATQRSASVAVAKFLMDQARPCPLPLPLVQGGVRAEGTLFHVRCWLCRTGQRRC